LIGLNAQELLRPIASPSSSDGSVSALGLVAELVSMAYIWPMRKSASGIKEIAKRAGVHHSTVSRVLNPQTRALVSAKVAAKILKIAETLGYRRNSMAVGLRTNRSFTIGVIVPDLTNPVFPPIVRAVERTMGMEGYVTVLADTDNSTETERNVLDSLCSRQVDGLVLASALLDDNIVAECRRRQVPFVLVNRTVTDTTATSVVTNDSYGIRLAVEHLVTLGHRKIAYLGGPLNTSTSRSRQQGFTEAMGAYHLKTDARIMCECKSWTIAAGDSACQRLIQSERPFTAIVAANDLLALGCYAALGAAGLKCPADVSVTGYNDMPFAEHFAPPLTTLRIPLTEMGNQAALLLLRKVRDPKTILPSVQLQPSLVVRGSTARLDRAS
jgi:LacI family transcriptional regulator